MFFKDADQAARFRADVLGLCGMDYTLTDGRAVKGQAVLWAMGEMRGYKGRHSSLPSGRVWHFSNLGEFEDACREAGLGVARGKNHRGNKAIVVGDFPAPRHY